ncbi:retrovirus-related pol polyprotein from transposon TNT 1-94 [Tanacetum coccineum]
MRKVHILLSMTDDDERKHAGESSSKPILEITSDSESESETQDPLLPLPKLIGAKSKGTLNSLISLADLTLNMAVLILDTSVLKKTKPISDKVSPVYVIKKRTEYKSPAVPNKNVDSSTEKLLLTLIEEMKNPNEVRVKELRSDNGTEFKNHKLEELCDENGISQNFSSPCTPEQNGIAERRNKTLIKAARTMLNSVNLPKQFWREDVNTACYTQNISIIVKRHRKTAYDVFRGSSLDISYFYVFGCHVHIYNHRNHLGKFDEKADDGFFLSYSIVAKAFRVFNSRRQEMEETIHVTFSEDDEYFYYIPAYENTIPTESLILQDFVSPKDPPKFTEADDHLTLNELDQLESADHFKLAET